MTLKTRLRELLEDRDHKNAVTLAKAALRNDDVVDVAVDGNTVTVETGRFRGVHRWNTAPDGSVVIDEQGTYTCTCDGVELSFSTMRMPAGAHERALERCRDRVGRARNEASTEDPGRSRDPEGPSADAGTRDGPPADATSGDGNPAPPTVVADGGDGDDGDGGEGSPTGRVFRRVRRFLGRLR